MTYYEDSWPEHFVQDADLFNKNISEVFHSDNTIFLIVKIRTEACAKIEGCDSGCWRIMGRDKLIKYEDTWKFLGFKKIFKFCGKRSWVLEEYRLPSKWNWKQDHVICKIRLMLHTEISFLLAKHSSFSADPLPETQFLPAYGICLIYPQVEALYYLHKLICSDGNKWPTYVTNDVFCMQPSKFVDPQDQKFMYYRLCIFANRTVASDLTDECDSGCWRNKNYFKLIKWEGRTMGAKTVFTFCEMENRRYKFHGEDVKVT